MPTRQELARDPAVLAQLHAAFDRVLETESALRAVREAGFGQPTVRRVAQLLRESRDLLNGLLSSDAAPATAIAR
jgi:hypothetical protein